MDKLTKLHDYSQNYNPYFLFWVKETALYEALKVQEEALNFPAVKDDVGIFLAFLSSLVKPKCIFEMGSGYGGSAFWFLSGYLADEIHLTEKRDDLESVFNQLSWPVKWKESLKYFQGDAFKYLDEIQIPIDLALVDGVKSDYYPFLERLHPKLAKDALVVVDNTFLKAKILDPEFTSKKSASSMLNMHEQLSKSTLYEPCFMPVQDGITILKKLL